jgi:hypothetical protein
MFTRPAKQSVFAKLPIAPALSKNLSGKNNGYRECKACLEAHDGW